MINLNISPDAYSRLRDKILSIGGEITRDGLIPIPSKKVTLEHTYDPATGKLFVSVKSKPFIVTVGYVESQVGDWITEAVTGQKPVS